MSTPEFRVGFVLDCQWLDVHFASVRAGPAVHTFENVFIALNLFGGNTLNSPAVAAATETWIDYISNPKGRFLAVVEDGPDKAALGSLKFQMRQSCLCGEWKGEDATGDGKNVYELPLVDSLQLQLQNQLLSFQL